MNAILANIYGTHEMEKTAAAQKGPQNLSDLALLLVYDEDDHGSDLTKVASVHKQAFEQIVSFDRAGRAMAQAEFSELEKAASEGNMEPLQAFFGDVVEQEPSDEEKAAALDAVKRELARRARK